MPPLLEELVLAFRVNAFMAFLPRRVRAWHGVRPGRFHQTGISISGK
jgi:hypothetical protein